MPLYDEEDDPTEAAPFVDFAAILQDVPVPDTSHGAFGQNGTLLPPDPVIDRLEAAGFIRAEEPGPAGLTMFRLPAAGGTLPPPPPGSLPAPVIASPGQSDVPYGEPAPDDGFAGAVAEALERLAPHSGQALAAHQIPPPEHDDPESEVTGWVMLAGRNAGKTYAGARWLHRFMSARPNLRARIIAPSFGDAVASCVEGPSGILAASNYQVQWKPAHPGGAQLVWPNGSVCYVIGTPTPRDVDRLRAIGNCLVPGTPVLRPDGTATAIEDLRPGDLVQTRFGPRPVTRAWSTTTRNTYELLLDDGRRIVGSAEHPVLLADGSEVPLDQLKSGDIVTVCRDVEPTSLMTSCSEVDDLVVHLTATGARSGPPSLTAESSSSTAQSTSTGEDPSHQDDTFTISTVTRRTADSRTSASSRLRNIYANILPRLPGKSASEWPSVSTTALGSDYGASVITATRSMSTLVLTAALGSARSDVSRRAPGSQPDVSSAAASLRPSQAGERMGPSSLGLAPARVLRCWPTGREETVHDITVAGVHEFIADGIITFNCDADWFEEAAANPQIAEAERQGRLSRRRKGAKWISTTTPRPLKVIRDWKKDPSVRISAATAHDNKHADPMWLQELERMYKGTRLYAQEVEGKVLEDVEGALWKQEHLERSRVIDVAALYEMLAQEEKRIIRAAVGVDPANSTGTTGIVAAVMTDDRHLYVVEDASAPGRSSDAWARVAVNLALQWDATIVAENDSGGDAIRGVLKAADLLDEVTIMPATARGRGSKGTRAEPIALLWERDDFRAHLVGTFPQLEEQMTTYVEGVTTDSPDRMDAMVWALTFLWGRATFEDVTASFPGDSNPAFATMQGRAARAVRPGAMPRWHRRKSGAGRA